MKIVLAFVLSLAMVACTSSKPEDKVAEAVDKVLGREALINQMEVEVTKLIGSEKTTFRKSFEEHWVKNLKVSFGDIKVDGQKATVRVSAVIPKEDEVSALFLMAALADQKKLREMTVPQFVEELAKGMKGKRKTASSATDFGTDTYEGVVELAQTGDEWNVDQKAKNFYSKQNKVKPAKKK